MSRAKQTPPKGKKTESTPKGKKGEQSQSSQEAYAEALRNLR